MLLKKLEEVENRFLKLEESLSDSEVHRNPSAYQKLAKEHSGLAPLINKYRQYKSLSDQVVQNKELLEDPDPQIREMAKAEIETLEEQLSQIDEEIRVLLLPRDPTDEKNTFLEIRAGTGGEEAALFAADLFRMYSKLAENLGWRVEIMSEHPTGMGGYKEIILEVKGDGVYGILKYESGVHRVQRVPATETQGRVHTSAATVAVLPEADEFDVDLKPSDIRKDTYCSSGPGGQSVNTTYSAVRLTHVPTGIVVAIQDEKSQIKNFEKAMTVLRTRLFEKEYQKYLDEISKKRKTMVSSGDRSAKVRTYNYPQSRVTDHRINMTVYNLAIFMDGNIQDMIEALQLAENAERLKAAAE